MNPSMTQVAGNDLTATEQRKALAQFVHRFTGDHKPQWTNREWKDGKPYPLQFASDSDWLANTRFWVRKDGQISKRHKYCESSPTWPNNPELRTGKETKHD